MQWQSERQSGCSVCVVRASSSPPWSLLCAMPGKAVSGSSAEYDDVNVAIQQALREV